MLFCFHPTDALLTDSTVVLFAHRATFPLENAIHFPLIHAGESVVSSQLRTDALHYGTKPGHFETSKIHFPTSEGVSEVSERANE